MGKKLLALVLSVLMLVSLLPVSALAAETYTVGHGADLKAYIDAYKNDADTATIRLTDSATLSNTVALTSNEGIILDLNGHSIEVSAGTGFVLTGNATLTLIDSSSGGGGQIVPDASDNHRAVHVNGGTFVMHGGTINGFKTATDDFGAGVYVESGKFQLSGKSSVTGNKAGTADSNVYLASGKKITVDGELKSGAKIGVSTADAPGKFTLTYGTDNSAVDPSTYFESDNTTYKVFADGTGADMAAKLAEPVTVKFDTNGGTPATVADQEIAKGDKATVPAVTYEGYTLAYWYTTDESVSALAAEATETGAIDATVTYKAKWTPIQYNLVYKANGGIGSDFSETTNPVEYNDGTKAIDADAAGFSKTGSTFKYWTTTPADSAPYYYKNDPVDKLTTGTTAELYAQWSPVGYTVTYYRNANASDTKAYVDPAEYAYNEYAQAMTYNAAAAAALAKDATDNWSDGAPAGKTVKVWNTEADGSGTSYTFGTTDIKVLGNVSLYASWEPITWTVTFVDGSETFTRTVATGSKVAEPNYTNASYPAKNYELTWLDSTNAVFDFVNTDIDSDITLTAKWTPKTVTIEFYNKDGAAASYSPISWIYGDYTATWPTAPTQAGATFKGWFDAAQNGTQVTETAAKAYDAGTYKLYEQWTADEHTVTFNPNYGSAATQSVTVEHGKTVTSVPTLNRENYDFEGWYLEAACSTSATPATYTVNADVEFFANWTPKQVTVNLVPGTDATLDGITSPVTYDFGALTQATLDSYKAKKDGSTFLGWALTEGGALLGLDDFKKFDAGEHTVYAVWDTSLIKVSFNSNCTDVANPADQDVTYGGHPTEPVLTRDNYTYGGWYREASCTTAFDFTADADKIVAPITLYAKWTAQDVTVSFMDGATLIGGAAVTKAYGKFEQTDLDAKIPTGVTGKTFKGWALTEGGALLSLEDFNKFDAASAHTVYAQWTTETVTVSFDPLTSDVATPTPVTVDSGKPVSQPIVNRANYTLDGWYKEPTFTTKWTFTDNVTETMTLYAKWTAKKVYVTFDAGTDGKIAINGTLTADQTYAVNADYNAFSGVIDGVTAEKDGYNFDGWFTAENGGTAVDTGVLNGLNADTYTSATPFMVHAHWSKGTYQVIIADGIFTKVTPSQGTANKGDKVNLLITLEEGEKLTTLTLTYADNTTETITVVDGVTPSFTMKAQNVTVSGTITYENYYVSFPASAHGTVTATVDGAAISSTTPINAGKTVQLIATPDAGYKFDTSVDKFTVTRADFGEVEVDGAYRFKMPGVNVSATATFTAVDYTVTVDTVAHGYAEADVTTANIGQTVTLTAHPDAGYKLVKYILTYGGSDHDLTTATFDMPAGNVTVTPVFEALSYNVTGTVDGGHGTITPAATTAATDSTVNLTVEPDTGYEIDTWSVKYGSADVAGAALSGTALSFTMPAGDVTVTAKFKAIPYTVEWDTADLGGATMTATKGGVAFYSGDTAIIGDVITFTITPGTLKSVATAKYTAGTEADLTYVTRTATEDTYTLTMPAANVTKITVTTSADVAKISDTDRYSTLADAFANVADGGTVTMLANTSTDPIDIASGKTVTLDLNGKNITASGTKVFRLAGTMTITDSSTGTEVGKIQGNNGATSVVGGGIVDVSGTGALILEKGTLEKGKVTSKGGAVEVAASGSFTMNGGTIQDCFSGGNGGAVFVNEGGTFTMNGGTITKNEATASGGGVYIASASAISHFTMTGGTITENKAGTSGGGVYAYDAHCETKLEGDPVIKGNTGGNLYVDAKITITGALTATEPSIYITRSTGVFTKNYGSAASGANQTKEPYTIFAPDDATKAIVKSGTGADTEAELVAAYRITVVSGSTGGSVTASAEFEAKGKPVTLTLKTRPDDGSYLVGFDSSTSDSNFTADNITMTYAADGTFNGATFDMPNAEITLTAKWATVPTTATALMEKVAAPADGMTLNGVFTDTTTTDGAITYTLQKVTNKDTLVAEDIARLIEALPGTTKTVVLVGATGNQVFTKTGSEWQTSDPTPVKLTDALKALGKLENGAQVKLVIDGVPATINVVEATDVLTDTLALTITAASDATAVNKAPVIIVTDADAALTNEIDGKLDAEGKYTRVGAVKNVDVYYNNQKLTDVTLSDKVQFLLPVAPGTYNASTAYYTGHYDGGDALEIVDMQPTYVSATGNFTTEHDKFSPLMIVTPTTHTIKYATDPHGTATGVGTAVFEETIEITVTPATGYHLEKLESYKDDGTGAPTGAALSTIIDNYTQAAGSGETKWNYQIPEYDVVIVATYVANEYTVTFEPVEGSVTPKTVVVTFDDTYGNAVGLTGGELPEPTSTTKTFQRWLLDNDSNQPITKDSIVKTAGNHTLYADFDPTLYTVTYDPNVPANSTYTTCPDVVAATVSTIPLGAAPTLNITDGKTYEFTGWNTQKDGNGTNYAAGANFTVSGTNANKDITLYAQWKETTPKTVTFAVDTTATPAETAASTGFQKTAPINTTIKTHDGEGFTKAASADGHTTYEIDGWVLDVADALKPNAGKIGLNADYVVTDDITLYAHWKVTTTEKFDLTFDLNYSGAPAAPTMDKQFGGDTITITVDDPTRTGYEFDGWTGAGMTGLKKGSSFDMPAANTTLVAQWTKLATVTYRANQTGATDPAAQTYRVGADVQLAEAMANVTDGSKTFKFAGWNTDAGGNGTGYTAGETINLAGDMELFAQWTEITEYTLTYDANGGTGTLPQNPTVVTGTAVSVEAGSLAKEHYSFTGWNTQADGQGTHYAVDSSFTVTADVTLYAEWLEDTKYELSFNLGGATGTAPTAQSYYGDYVVTLDVEDPTWTGYEFEGWSGAGKTGLKKDSTFTMPKENTVLTAVWTKLYTVTYEENAPAGATVSGMPSVRTFQVKTGTSITTAAAPTATATGKTYAFAGWATTKSGTGGDTYGANVSVAISGDVTLYAQWTETTEYTLSYNANGGTGTLPDAKTVVTGTAVKVGEANLNKDGYILNAWNTQDDGLGAHYAVGDDYIVKADTVLYAEWVLDTKCTVVYFPNGATNAPSNAIYDTKNQTQVELVAASKDGSDFAGWAEADADGNPIVGGHVYQAGDMLPLQAGKVIRLVSTWTAKPTYTVTYAWAPTTATISGTVPAQLTDVETGTSITLDNNAHPTRTHPTNPHIKYEFDGWVLDPNQADDESATFFNIGTAYTVTGDVTFYSHWKVTEDTKYTVSYDLNGGSVDTAIPSGDYYVGEDVQVTSVVPTYTGWKFVGWLNSYSNQVQTSVNDFDMPATNVKMKAQWEPEAKFAKIITTSPLPDGTYAIYYETQLSAKDTKTPGAPDVLRYYYLVTEDGEYYNAPELPAGLTLTTEGKIYGVPTEVGEKTVWIQMTDVLGNPITEKPVEFTIKINKLQLEIDHNSNPTLTKVYGENDPTDLLTSDKLTINVLGQGTNPIELQDQTVVALGNKSNLHIVKSTTTGEVIFTFSYDDGITGGPAAATLTFTLSREHGQTSKGGFENVGTYKMSVDVSGNDSTKYELSVAKAWKDAVATDTSAAKYFFTITPRPLGFAWDATVPTYTYNGTEQTMGGALDNYMVGDDVSVAYTYTRNGEDVQVSKDAGIYVITPALDGADKGNYSVTFNPPTQTYVINKVSLADPSVTFSPATIDDQAYTGSAIEPTVDLVFTSGTYTETLIKGTDYTAAYEKNVNVAGGPAVITYTATAASNFTGSKTISFNVIQAQNEITKLKVKEVPYGQTPVPEIEAKFGADTATYEWFKYDQVQGYVKLPAGQLPKDAAPYRVVATIPETDNYTKAVSQTVEFSIVEKDVTLSWATSPASLVADGSAKEYTAKVNGAAAGDNPTVTVTYTAKSGSTLTNGKAVEAGNYTATATLTDSNYKATPITKDFTITSDNQGGGGSGGGGGTGGGGGGGGTGGGGGGGSAGNKLILSDASNGTVEFNSSALKGAKSATVVAKTEIKLDIKPAQYYKIDTVSYTTSKDKTPVVLTPNEDGTYTIKMPDAETTVTATFKPENENDSKIGRAIIDSFIKSYKDCDGGKSCPLNKFDDLITGAWYHDGIHFCLENGIMQGFGNEFFKPNETTTRAQVVTVLWNIAGHPIANSSVTFGDVTPDKWYYNAIMWAAANGIVNGYGEDENGINHFGPDDLITREQIAKILYGYAKFYGYDVSASADLTGIPGADKISDWAVPYVKWAVGAHVCCSTDGVSEDIAPLEKATRAELATMILNFCINVAIKLAEPEK